MPSGINPDSGLSHRFIDRSGHRSGRLVFLEHVGYSKHRHSRWLCKCDCGNETITTTPKTKSCGCLHKELAAQRCRERKQDDPISRTKEYVRDMKKRFRQSPINAMHNRISRLHRHALAQVNAIKKSPTFESLGYTVDEFVRHIERQFISGMSWENMSEWQIDHIIPISTAKTESDVVSLNQLSNLRPMWAAENNAKKNKIESLI